MTQNVTTVAAVRTGPMQGRPRRENAQRLSRMTMRERLTTEVAVKWSQMLLLWRQILEILVDFRYLKVNYTTMLLIEATLELTPPLHILWLQQSSPLTFHQLRIIPKINVTQRFFGSISLIKWHWDFCGDCIKSAMHIALGNMVILTVDFSNPWTWNIFPFLCIFESVLIILCNFQYRSFTYFVILIPGYFIVHVAIRREFFFHFLFWNFIVRT